MPKLKHKPIPALSVEKLAEFNSKVNVKGPDECWPWLGATLHYGYGAFSLGDHVYRSSRIAFFLATGDDPGDKCTLHRCDCPPCCNPAHLWLGTDGDNMKDKLRKGRGGDSTPKTIHRGDQNWSRINAHLLPRGKDHWTARQPERVVRGEKHWKSKFTGAQILEIRQRHKAGESQSQLARSFSVNSTAICAIVNRRTGKHIMESEAEHQHPPSVA